MHCTVLHVYDNSVGSPLLLDVLWVFVSLFVLAYFATSHNSQPTANCQLLIMHASYVETLFLNVLEQIHERAPVFNVIKVLHLQRSSRQL